MTLNQTPMGPIIPTLTTTCRASGFLDTFALGQVRPGLRETGRDRGPDVEPPVRPDSAA